MILAKNFVVRGSVQGVGFRYFTVGVAERLGVKGFVRNLRSGDVEIHAEADELTLQLFKRELEAGPRMAQVTEVLESTIPVSGKFSSFGIRG